MIKNIILLISLLLVFNQYEGKGQASALIINEQAISDTVDLGMCLVGDSLQTTFRLVNTGSVALRVFGVDPSFFLGRPVNYDKDDYREFFDFNPKVPFITSVGNSTNFIIQFNAREDLISFPLGKKIALLKMGLYDPVTAPEPPLLSDMVAYKEYILKAKKTNKYIDGFDDAFNFDTVYINPVTIPQYNWKVQNSSNFSLAVETEIMQDIGQKTINGEFLYQRLSDNLNFPNKWSQKEWLLQYKPINRGNDTARFELYFKPDPINYPDSSVIAFVNLFGFAAEQMLTLHQGIFAEVNADTIDIGDVRIGNSKDFSILFRNEGNLNFGVSSQAILKESLDQNDATYTFLNYLLAENAHLLPNAVDTVTIRFTPFEKGLKVSRYLIESDIAQRKISGIPNSARRTVFYLKARGVEPNIAIAEELIDFGNIVVSNNCPTTIDTTILIANTGNEILKIHSISFSPDLPSPFTLDKYEMEIAPNSTEKLKIQFSTDGLPLNVDFPTDLVFRTNCNFPKDEVIIHINARSIPTVSMNLEIPKTLRSKPNREIEVPLIIEKSKVNRANTFEATISYDRTILKYRGFNTLNTASESTQDILMSEENGAGKLRILINSNQQNFLERDTLIKLKFFTTVGKAVSTPISFESAIFGDDYCESVLNIPNLAQGNGIYTLDSVCGLNLKTTPFITGIFRFEDIYPNPANSTLNFEYELAYSSSPSIRIFNFVGEEVKRFLALKLPAGSFTLSEDISDLPAGIYYCEFKVSNFKSMKVLTISR